ncbi:MAG: LAGLIDADG family homing endonuclease [Candidatus Zixiibacteriota bacterium]
MDCISIQDIVPKERVVGSKKREFKVEKVGNGKIKVSYDAIKGKGPKPFVFPKRVELNEKLAEAVGLYVGDGSFAGHPGHSTFSNKDAELVKLMFDFFLGLGVREADMSIFISYRDGDESKIKKWWANKLGISPDKMQIKKSERHRYSTLGIQVNGVIFKLIFKQLVENVLNLLKLKGELRRGFLRGLFAAEGCIAVKEGYINHMSIAYNSKTETENRDFYRELLKIEDIPTYTRESGNGGEIIIRNWKNYYKLWNIAIADLCKRKEERFVNIMRGLEVFCSLEDGFRKDMFQSFGASQRKIAKILDSYQGNISRNIKGTILLSMEQLITASNFIGKKEFCIKRIIENTNYIRVGRLTTIRNVRNDFLQMLFKLKSN